VEIVGAPRVSGALSFLAGRDEPQCPNDAVSETKNIPKGNAVEQYILLGSVLIILPNLVWLGWLYSQS
jgi:hypothetical protein